MLSALATQSRLSSKAGWQLKSVNRATTICVNNQNGKRRNAKVRPKRPKVRNQRRCGGKAKNLFGAYTGYKRFMYGGPDMIFIENDPALDDGALKMPGSSYARKEASSRSDVSIKYSSNPLRRVFYYLEKALSELKILFPSHETVKIGNATAKNISSKAKRLGDVLAGRCKPHCAYWLMRLYQNDRLWRKACCEQFCFWLHLPPPNQ